MPVGLGLGLGGLGLGVSVRVGLGCVRKVGTCLSLARGMLYHDSVLWISHVVYLP
jgi:hypothetical protein